MGLKDNSNAELLNMYANILTELNNRGVVRTYNSPVGDYAEWLVANKLGLKLEQNSRKGYDACNPKDGTTYQVKSRWERGKPSIRSRELNVIRNYEENQFDYLIVVIFNESFGVKEAYRIPHNVICRYSRYRKHHNGHILLAMGKVLHDPEVINITDAL